jgi:hypothetical protein
MILAAEGQGIGGTGVFNAGERAYRVENVFVEDAAMDRVGVSFVRGENDRGQYSIGLKARIDRH